MKITNYIYLLFFASILIFGCNSKTDLNPEGEKKQDNIVSKFLSDVKSLETDTNTNPIVAFKELAEKIAEDKIILSKKNIKKVLIKSKEFSNCVIITGKHTIVKIISFDNCQQSGSWKACMPTVEGYIKKGKLNYKKDFMNNVIGIPDKQERVAYFFNSDEIISKTKADSYEQGPYSEYYENGEIKVNGCGYKKFYRYFVSAKDGINLMESADLKSKKIRKIPFGDEVYFKSCKISTELNTFKETGNIRSVNGEWVKIEVELELSPGDQGYYYDEIEDAPLKLFGGYVMNGFLEKKIDSIKKPGIWTYFYESGIIKKEAFFYSYGYSIREIDELESYLDVVDYIKEINYDNDGDISKISEKRVNAGVRYVSNTFHKNGNIKDISDAGFSDAVSISFDENGKYVGDWDYSSMKNHFDEINLTKDIRDFYLHDSEKIFKEIKTLQTSELKDEENIISENKMISYFSGVYGYNYENGASGEVRIHPESDTSALFHLDVYNGPPSYNSGALNGRIILKAKNEYIFSEINEDYGTNCVFTISLDGDKLSVSNSNPNGENQCGFGNNVYASGTYPLLDRAIPQFYYSGEGSKIYFSDLQSEINAAEEKNRIPNEETVSKSPNYYICYKGNNNENLQLWIGFDEKAKAFKVKYKGMNLDMDLVFVKEINENEGGPYPVLAEYYNEIYEEEVNGVYKLTKSGNWYYAEYTRKSDNKQFNFTIDNKSNNFSDSPCF